MSISTSWGVVFRRWILSWFKGAAAASVPYALIFVTSIMLYRFNDFGRNAGDYCVGRDILRHDRTGGHYRIFSDGDTWQYGGSCADPCPASYDNGFSEQSLSVIRVQWVALGDEVDPGTDEHVVFDGDAAQVKERARVVDEDILPDGGEDAYVCIEGRKQGGAGVYGGAGDLTQIETDMVKVGCGIEQLRKTHGSFYAFGDFMVFRIIHSDGLACLEPLKDVWCCNGGFHKAKFGRGAGMLFIQDLD